MKIKMKQKNGIITSGSNQKGITLIALVIGIVVLIILAGVITNMALGDEGIINRAKQAKKEQKKAQYYEDINLEIIQEQIERQTEKKEELFITSIEYRLGGTSQILVTSTKVYEKKQWVHEVTNDSNQTLIVDTIDGYQIFIDCDNENNIAIIRAEDNFKEKTEGYAIITLDKQGGLGGTTEIYEKYDEGYYTDLKCTNKMSISANGITIPTRSGYIFEGYYTGESGEGTQYINTSGKITSSASATNFSAAGTLYAYWKQVNAQIPTMTGLTTPSGKITYSSIYDNGVGTYGSLWAANAYMVFNGVANEDKGWYGFGGNKTGVYEDWIQYEFTGTARIVKWEFDMISNYRNVAKEYDISLLASNDNMSFITLDTHINVDMSNGMVNYSFNNENYYKYYRVKIKSLTPGSSKVEANCSHIQLYGASI